MFSLLVLCAVVLSVSADTPFEKCAKYKNTPIDITKVVVPNCNGPPCTVKKGSNVSLTLTFTTGATVYNTLENKVYGELGFDIPFPNYPTNMKDVCKLGVSCPTKPKTEYTENVVVPVSTKDPSITVTAKWELIGNGQKDPVACIEVPLKIVS